MTSLLFVVSAFALDPLQNPGFESGDFSGWASWGDQTAVVTDPVYEGTYAARFALDPASTGFQQTGMYQDVANAVGGESLQFTLVARASTTDPVLLDGRLLVKWEATGDAGFQSGSAPVPLTADGAWVYGKVSFTTPVGATSVRYTLLCEATEAGASGTVYVDRLEIGPAVYDLCPLVLFDQLDDADADGRGDACDRCPNDADPADIDLDGDDIGDACDACAGDNTTGDADGDGFCADLDACDDPAGCDTGDTDAADTDTGVRNEGDDIIDDEGCGCDQGRASWTVPWLALALLARRRR